MNCINFIKDIDRKRELWDRRSIFRMWDVSGITLEDLDELEDCLDSIANNSLETIIPKREATMKLLAHIGVTVKTERREKS